MKISCIQLDARLAAEGDPYAYAEKMIDEAVKENPDTILLPEKWNAFGHPTTHRAQSDSKGDKTKKLLSRLAKKHHLNIVGGSITEEREDKLYNTCHVFNREGEDILVYDKVHLYKEQEKNYYAAGDAIGLFTLDGISCGVAICYDMDFPEWIRCYGIYGVDILFAPFAWPSKWMHHLDMVQKARALENQCFVASAGLCKSDGDGHYRSGGTSLAGPHGDFIKKAGKEPGVLTGKADRETLMAARKWQHFLDDRREDLYRKYGF